MRRLVLVALLSACGGSTPHATTPSGPRTAPNDAAIAELARAEESYEALVQAWPRIDCTSHLNLEEFMECIEASTTSLSNAAEETSAAFRLVTDHDISSTSRLAASAGEARTQNFVVTTIHEAEVPRVLPTAVLQMVSAQSIKQRVLDELYEQVLSTMQRVLVSLSAPAQCAATVQDVTALRLARDFQLDTSYSQESMARLRSHNDESIIACVNATTEELPPYTPGELNLQR